MAVGEETGVQRSLENKASCNSATVVPGALVDRPCVLGSSVMKKI